MLPCLCLASVFLPGNAANSLAPGPAHVGHLTPIPLAPAGALQSWLDCLKGGVRLGSSRNPVTVSKPAHPQGGGGPVGMAPRGTPSLGDSAALAAAACWAPLLPSCTGVGVSTCGLSFPLGEAHDWAAHRSLPAQEARDLGRRPREGGRPCPAVPGGNCPKEMVSGQLKTPHTRLPCLR